MAKAGEFIWYEMMTTDMGAAETFYTSVVGWDAADAGMPGPKYTLLSKNGVNVAGLSAVEGGMPPAWLGHVLVEDVDATADKAVTLGGKIITAPQDIPGIGRFAALADPHGAVILIFRGDGDPPPSLGPMDEGNIGWHELMAGDLDEAFAFYSALFGWVKDEAMDMGEMGIYQLFKLDGGEAAIGGMMTKSKDMPAPPYWGYYANVDAIDAAVDRIKAGGGQIVFGPMEVPGGAWAANGIDPQGALFSIVAPKR